MDKKELLEKFCLIFHEVKKSRKIEDSEVSLLMFKKAVELLAEANLRSAKELIECYEGTLKYNNFLTESEAEYIVERFSNEDGSRGAKWRDPEELFRKVDEIGKIECSPHYNKWALYVAMNKFASDQHNAILKWVGDKKEKYFEACYDLAITQLKDKDRPFWIRPYYNIGE